MNKDKKSKLVRMAEIVLALFIVVDLVTHYKAMTRSPIVPIPVVMVKKPVLRQVVEYITQTGNTVAFNSVD